MRHLFSKFAQAAKELGYIPKTTIPDSLAKFTAWLRNI